MVKQMEEKTEIKAIKISKFRMFLKFAKVVLYLITRIKWFNPGVAEIKVDELNELLNSENPPIIVDVRNREEFYAVKGSVRNSGHIQDSKSFPIMKLAASLKNLTPFKDDMIVTICPGGGMSLTAAEIMTEAGFADVRSLKGGMFDWEKKGYPTTKEIDPNYPLDEYKQTVSTDSSNKKPSINMYIGEVQKTVDARGLSCPGPILNSKKAIMKLKVGQVLEILTTDPGSKTDIPAWAHVTGQELIAAEDSENNEFRFIVKKLK